MAGNAKRPARCYRTLHRAVGCYAGQWFAKGIVRLRGSAMAGGAARRTGGTAAGAAAQCAVRPESCGRGDDRRIAAVGLRAGCVSDEHCLSTLNLRCAGLDRDDPSSGDPGSNVYLEFHSDLYRRNSGTLGNSAAFQSGTGATAKIGINTTTPTTTLDVKGTGTVRGLFALPSVAVATATKRSNSQPIAMTASAFNSSTSAAVNGNFRWQAEPAANNTASPSATLNLLFGSGTTAPVETGLKVSSTGLFTFATGQTSLAPGRSRESLREPD